MGLRKESVPCWTGGSIFLLIGNLAEFNTATYFLMNAQLKLSYRMIHLPVVFQTSHLVPWDVPYQRGVQVSKHELYAGQDTRARTSTNGNLPFRAIISFRPTEKGIGTEVYLEIRWTTHKSFVQDSIASRRAHKISYFEWDGL